MLDFARLQAALVAAAAKLVKLRGDITGLKAQIAVLEAEKSALQQQVADLQAQVDPEAQTKVDTFATQAEQVVTDMTVLDEETADIPAPPGT